MSVNILFSLAEAVVLLDGLLCVLDGSKTRKETVIEVSKILRDYAVKNGVKIDDKFRNENGIASQLRFMEYWFTDGRNEIFQGKRCPKTFNEAIRLYRSDKSEFDRILNEVRSMGNEEDDKDEEILELKYSNDVINHSSVPISAVYYDRNITDIKSWIDLYIKFMKIIWIEKSAKLKKYFGKSFWSNGRIDICDDKCRFLLTNPVRISQDIFIETYWSNQEVADRLKQVLDISGVPTKRLKITYRQPKTKNENNIDSNLITESRAVLLEYFVNGMKKDFQDETGKLTIEGRRFVRGYKEKYNKDFPIDVKIEDVISSFAMLYDGKYYALTDDAVKFVKNIINKLMPYYHVFFYSVLYEKFSSELSGYRIYSDNMLSMLVKRVFPSYKYKKNYFTDQSTELEEIILELFRQHGALDFERISELMPYVDIGVVRQICSRKTELIRIGEGRYFPIENIEFDKQDIIISKMTIENSIRERKYCLVKALTVDNSTVSNENIPFSILQTVLFERFFSDKYVREGRLISAKNEIISVDRLLAEYCREHKHITLEELQNYELEITENDKRRSLKAANKYMIRTDAENFVSKDEIVFDVEETDEKIALFFHGKVISLADIRSFNLFPYVAGFVWNSFLLASYIRHYSKKWKLECIDGRNDIAGAIIRADMKYKDYDEVLMTAVAESDIELDEDEVNCFLISHVFRMRKTDVSNIISGAYRIREKLE